MIPDEIKRKTQQERLNALKHFPFKLIETNEKQALATWQELRSAGQGYPVILGGDDESDHFDNLLMPFGPQSPQTPSPSSVEKILQTAAAISFPNDLAIRQKDDAEAALAWIKAHLATTRGSNSFPRILETIAGTTRTLTEEETVAAMAADPKDPPLGNWPTALNPSNGPLLINNTPTDNPFRKIYIGLAPTDDWTAIPALLRWGGWHACPHAEYHVAAFRQWRDHYGAELVAIDSDTISLRVATRPRTREEALALARTQYIYCADLIDQGVGTYNALAAELMASDWWNFWWD